MILPPVFFKNASSSVKASSTTEYIFMFCITNFLTRSGTCSLVTATLIFLSSRGVTPSPIRITASLTLSISKTKYPFETSFFTSEILFVSTTDPFFIIQTLLQKF